MVTHLDLCSGIGGFALACRWLGIETVGFCEIDPWCQKVLTKNFPGVPIHDDVRTLGVIDVRQWIENQKQSIRDEGATLADAALMQRSAVKRSQPDGAPDERGTARLDLITAGYPCQPFSHAGKRLGAEDDRHLWPAIAALVSELRPRWCLFENVAGHVSLGLDDVLADLETRGYTCWPVVIPACAVNAPHRRDRVWIVAHAGCERPQGQPDQGAAPRATESQLGQRHDGISPRLAGPGWWDDDWERGIPRVATGVVNRVQKLRGLGNAIVPQVAYMILSAMLSADLGLAA